MLGTVGYKGERSCSFFLSFASDGKTGSLIRPFLWCGAVLCHREKLAKWMEVGEKVLKNVSGRGCVVEVGERTWLCSKNSKLLGVFKMEHARESMARNETERQSGPDGGGFL